MESVMVSVIIPTFNRAECIKDSVLSVLNQTYTRLECIVVDDASTDNTGDIIKDIKDPRLIYIKKDVNGGPSQARNLGIQTSHGDYIAFNDSDDIWMPDKLEKQLCKFREDVGLVYCGYEYIKDGKRIKIPSDIYDMEELDGSIFNSLWESNKIGTPTIMVKRTCIDALGGFKGELTSLEDWEFVLRISSYYRIGYVPGVLVEARYSAAGVNTNMVGQVDTLIYLIKEYSGRGISLENKIKLLVERLGKISNKSTVNGYVDKLIPDIFLSKNEFLRLLEISRENAKLKRMNRILMALCDDGKLLSFIKEKIDMVNDKVAIYGAGDAGVFLARRLGDNGVSVDCIIDRNQIHSSCTDIVKPEALNGDVNVIISTIVSEDIESIEKLWERDIRIVNIFEPWTPE